MSTNPTNGRAEALKAKDFATDQDVRWCPGCGDYSILKQVQTVFAELGLDRDKVAIVSGIGCSSRFPYYMEAYGLHSIHGRAPAFASGLKLANPDLQIWMVTGDGDGFSIGGNHMLHAIRRNFDLNIMVFNNQIYGLTKGQYSPTSELWKKTKSTPAGSIDYPINPLAFALGCQASFVARSMDRDPKHLKEMLHRCHGHKGTSFLEIYQNCNIFNDGAFFAFTEKERKADTCIFLEDGKPLIFGANLDKGIRMNGLRPEVVSIADGAYSPDDLWLHDEKDVFKASMLARFFDDPGDEGALPRPFGVIYADERATYDDLCQQQMEAAGTADDAYLDKLIAGPTTWQIK